MSHDAPHGRPDPHPAAGARHRRHHGPRQGRHGPFRDVVQRHGPAGFRARGCHASLVLVLGVHGRVHGRRAERSRLRHRALGRRDEPARQSVRLAAVAQSARRRMGGRRAREDRGRQDPARARLHRGDRDVLQGRRQDRPPDALHMPSHIVTRRGYWGESIEANRASINAISSHFDRLHALDYLTYAYLQTAQDGAAKGVVDQVSELPKVNVEHFVTAFALATIPSRYALERGRWADAAKLELFGKEFPWGRFPQSEAQLVFARGLGAARGGDVTSARRDVERLGALRDTLAAAKVGYWAEQVDIQRQVASAWVARAEGRTEEALALLRAAADREDATEKHPVTPGPIAPARELLAEMLLEANEPAQALREFEASMRVEPNRFRGLYGAARAADLSGDRTKARTYYSTLLSLGEKGDTERPELRQAKAFLGK